MFFSLIGSIRSDLYKAARAFGDLDGIGLQFAKQSADVVGAPQTVNEIFNLVIKRNNQCLHMGFDHVELVGDGLSG